MIDMSLDMKKCSRCGKPFDELIIAVKLDMEVFRIKTTGVPEMINNLDQESKEFICKDCFDKFADVLGQMNIKHKDPEKEKCEPKIETEIVDDVKYENE